MAQFSILGSLFANALLVLGLAIVAGSTASRDGTMRFQARLPNDTATLTLLSRLPDRDPRASPTRSATRPASTRSRSRSSAPSACSSSTARGSSAISARTVQAEPSPEHAHDVLPFPVAIALLAVAGVSAALVSDWFVDAIDPAVEKLGISKAFTGLVIVAIAGNAVENVVAITARTQGQVRSRDLRRQELGRRRSRASSSPCSCSSRCSSPSSSPS